LPVALVIDERGDIEGLITLTDVLAALVGEVPDEDEPARKPSWAARTVRGWWTVCWRPTS
jgi:putative hemolysin